MLQDTFFSTYGFETLIIRGIIASAVQRASSLIAELKTSGSTRVFCDLGAKTIALHDGDPIAVEVGLPSRDVTRQGSDVSIKNCTIP